VDSSLRDKLHKLYAAYCSGQFDEVIDMLDDHITMTSYAPVAMFPYLGRQQGKEAVAATLHAAHAEFEYLNYTPVFMVTEKENAAVIVLAKLRQRTTKRIIQLFIADFFRLEGGRIFELRQFMDSFDAVQQVLGRELALSQKPR